tara:strand:- start:3 stop:146 length:144 start_codon:yes stop_codon:yes gene_type:complete
MPQSNPNEVAEKDLKKSFVTISLIYNLLINFLKNFEKYFYQLLASNT